MAQEKLSKQERGREDEVAQVAGEAATAAEVAERKDTIDADVDSILDEIDDVLETNAEDFVKSFIQKGGE